MTDCAEFPNGQSSIPFGWRKVEDYDLGGHRMVVLRKVEPTRNWRGKSVKAEDLPQYLKDKLDILSGRKEK